MLQSLSTRPRWHSCAVWVGLAIVTPGALSAAAAPTTSPEGKLRSGSEVVIRAGETIPHDLYIGSGRVRMEGRVEGDLVVAGGEIELSGPVGGDVMVAGGSIRIRSQVGGDLRVAGGEVIVEGPVGEDLFAGAGDLRLSSASRVGEDLIFGSGQMRMDGAVEGDVLGSTGSYVRQGSVTGSERVKVEERKGRREAPPTAIQRLVQAARQYVSVLLIGALLLWIAPRMTASAASMVRDRPLPSLGVGVLGAVGYVVFLLALLVATGLAALGAAITSGALAGLASSLAFFLTVFFVAHALVGMALGDLALRRGDEVSRARSLGALALGAAALAILWAVPLLGDLIRLLSALVGLGALVLLLRRARREGPSPAPASTASP
jgi:hypothetical protein